MKDFGPNYYVQIRTPARKEGDAQVGITYGLYLALFGAIVTSGAMCSGNPTFDAYNFADYIIVRNGDIRHASRSCVDKAIMELGREGFPQVTISDLIPVFSSMGIVQQPNEGVAATLSDVSYERYQNLIKRLHEGSASAGEAAKALRAWQSAGKATHEEATAIINEIQFGFDLEGGKMNDD